MAKKIEKVQIKKKYPSKINNFIPLLIVPLVIFALVGGSFWLLSRPQAKNAEQTISVKTVSGQIDAEGTVTSQQLVTLHFQTGGKMVYVLKEGTPVTQGQAIARLDTYALQRQLSTTLNNFRSTRDVFDQLKQNSQDNVVQGQQKYLLDVQSKGVFPNSNESPIIDDIVKRIIDENQASLDNAVINVELANYALQLATLTSPINGVITRADIDVPNVNVTSSTGFTVANPNDLVFQAHVGEKDIDFVSEGATALIKINGLDQSLTGTVTKVYPGKMTLPDGRQVYRVDISSDKLNNKAKLDQTGTVLINSNAQNNALLVPLWTVLANKYIWVANQGRPVLKTVRLGKRHGDQIEVIGGLSAGDKIITNPQFIVTKNY